jgi:hypothetical protein
MNIEPGQTVYFIKTEEYWDKPFVMKRHHVYQTRTVILQGEVIEVRGEEFKVRLYGNNGFERDGGTYVFNKGNLLCNQNLQNKELLGQWSHEDLNK